MEILTLDFFLFQALDSGLRPGFLEEVQQSMPADYYFLGMPSMFQDFLVEIQILTGIPTINIADLLVLMMLML